MSPTASALSSSVPKLSFPNPSILYPCSSSIHSSCFFSPHCNFSFKPLHSQSSPLLCHAHSHNFHFLPSNFTQQHDKEDQFQQEEEEEQVIGDCLIFEDGIFEDPFLQEELNPDISLNSKPTQVPNSMKQQEIIQPQNLVPEEWTRVVEEINMTKKERRKIAKEMEFGQKIVKRKIVNVNMQEYLKLRNEKLAQLNPVVLDNPNIPEFRDEKRNDFDDESDSDSRMEKVSSRVEPKNPRWAVYGRGLDDITEFFNSGNYQNSDDNSDGRKGHVLFTKEEKALMNARKPKLEVATSQKWLPLHALAASGEFYFVNNLLKFDVDINAADQDGLTALHKAITCKKQAIINYLLRESADPLVRDKDGATLMHYAVRTASSQTIKTLLLHDVDINQQDNDGWTPLHLAVQARRTDVVRLLLMKGADKILKNKDGLTPLELCLHFGKDTKTYELIKLLKQLPRQHR